MLLLQLFDATTVKIVISIMVAVVNVALGSQNMQIRAL